MTNQYNPDTVSPPGDTLWDWMEEHEVGMYGNRPVVWVSRMTGLRYSLAAGLLWGTLPITPDLAQKPEQATSTPASFWLERERIYREAQCKSE